MRIRLRNMSAIGLAIALLAPLARRCGDRGLEARPNAPFPPSGKAGLLAYLSVRNTGDDAVPLRMRVWLDGKPEQVSDLGAVARGDSTRSLLIPDIGAPTKLAIDLLDANGTSVARWEGAHEPQRKWTVYVVKSSREDLGYEGFIHEKQREIADNIDLGRKKRAEPDAPAGAAQAGSRKFHYMMESLIFQQNYTEERSEAAWRDLV